MDRLAVQEGDITGIPVDAIVNAANSGLRGGGGVDGAIHRAGGPTLMQELSEIRRRTGGCPTGSAVETGAGNLPAQWVFHAVGPVYRDGLHGEPELLASCYRKCLAMAEERGLRTISFPAISTGVYGYPMEEAARVAIAAVTAHLAKPESRIERVIFVMFGKAAYETYRRALDAADHSHFGDFRNTSQ